MSAKMTEVGWEVALDAFRACLPVRGAKALYRGRARIEQMTGRLKRFKRPALRCENTARNFRSTVALAATFVLVKFVLTALPCPRQGRGWRALG